MINSKTLITIPVFNGEQFIARSLDSCVAQTTKTDVVVLDNRSTDNTQSIVRQYAQRHPNIKLIINDENVGRVGNWNRCLEIFEESESDYLKMVFCGDVLLDSCVEAVERVFEQEAGVGIVAWPYKFFDARKGTSRIPRILHEDIRLNKFQLVERDMYPSQFAGAIICHTFAKFAIKGERFNEIFLGMAEFTNKVPLKSDFYHINTPLSEFHLDCHGSYAKQFDYLFVVERAYTKAIGLKKAKEWMAEDDYLRHKQAMYEQLIETFR